MTSDPNALSKPNRVTVVGVDIPVGDLVVLILKLVVASIPAAIVIAIVGFIITVILTAIGMSL
ncbi:hypothetical protein K8I85_00465 [bacterium]|nr:hypothetical protein [bacterium]